MRVLVLGGDGFCGWPTTLYLSDRGHDVTIVDNLSRRKIDIDLEVQSLTPIRPVGERIRAWQELSGRTIGFIQLDLATEYDRLVAVLRELWPDAILHFAEQRRHVADAIVAKLMRWHPHVDAHTVRRVGRRAIWPARPGPSRTAGAPGGPSGRP